MTLEQDPARAVRPARADAVSSVRDVSHATQTGTLGLTNARTRIVGDRTGAGADVIVGLVRSARVVRGVLVRFGARVAAVVTPLGWTMLATTIAGFIAGYGLGIVEFIIVAYTSVILILIAVAYLVGRNSFTIELDVVHRHVVVGEPGVGTVVVRNPSRHRVFGTRVELPVGESVLPFGLPGIAAGAEFRRDFPVATGTRGVFDVGPARTVRADPVGLVRRELVWTDAVQFFVHPRTIGVPSTSTGLIRDLEGQPTSDLTNSDVSFHALREYVPGDERRYIHWKSTAKTGTYMVRQFEETRRSRLVVALSLATGDFASDEEFEMAVSAAGSLGLRAIRDARDISVVVGRTTPEFAKKKLFGIRQLDSLNRMRLLDDLAGVERAESSLSLVDIARVVSDRVVGISVAYLVCGSLTTPGALRAASVQFPAGVEVIAVICDPDAAPGLRRVSELNVLTIGYLEDLQRSLARAASL